MAPQYTTAKGGGSAAFAGVKNCPLILNIKKPAQKQDDKMRAYA